MYGEYPAALAAVSRVAAEARGLAVSAPFVGTVKSNVLRGALTTETLAALPLGRYSEAETAARERFDLPPNPFSDFAPEVERTSARVTLAHALASQGRLEEARTIMEPELAGYQARRRADLAEARKALARIPTDAQRIYEVRELTRLVGEAARGG